MEKLFGYDREAVIGFFPESEENREAHRIMEHGQFGGSNIEQVPDPRSFYQDLDLDNEKETEPTEGETVHADVYRAVRTILPLYQALAMTIDIPRKGRNFGEHLCVWHRLVEDGYSVRDIEYETDRRIPHATADRYAKRFALWRQQYATATVDRLAKAAVLNRLLAEATAGLKDGSERDLITSLYRDVKRTYEHLIACCISGCAEHDLPAAVMLHIVTTMPIPEIRDKYVGRYSRAELASLSSTFSVFAAGLTPLCLERTEHMLGYMITKGERHEQHHDSAA